MVNLANNEGILDFRKRVSMSFPDGSITAILVGDDSMRVVLEYHGNHQFNKDAVLLSLHADRGVPTGVDFSKVIIESSIELKGVRVYWRNYKY